MKNAMIFHGHGSTSKSFWHPWLKTELEKLDYSVWLPDLPNTDKPDIKKWLPFVLDKGRFYPNTILVGYSCGCPLIFSILENIDVTIRKSVLIAGFSEPLNKNPDPILQKTYYWNKIKKHCKEFIFINSDNDPWGCDDKMGRKMFKHLGGMLIIRHGDGHMGSDTFKQPYKEFPLLLQLINKL
jgi:predicted alpha/beta hydrolase family esterase